MQKKQHQWANMPVILAKEFWNKNNNSTRGYFNEDHYYKFLKARSSYVNYKNK